MRIVYNRNKGEDVEDLTCFFVALLFLSDATKELIHLKQEKIYSVTCDGLD